MDEIDLDEEFEGVKTIDILATTRYPIVSAYEFEFLKEEASFQRLLKRCTIYFILQRPLLYISDLRYESGVITFLIQDGTETTPLKCEFDLSLNDIGQHDEEVLIDIQFYKKVPDVVPPFNDIAIFKLATESGKHLGYFSPTLLLYNFIARTLNISITGPLRSYINYDVHYIGKSFSQDIWERLTGHEKLQSILTREDVMGCGSNRTAFEIALLMLDIDGLNENKIYVNYELMLGSDAKPIVHPYTCHDDDPRWEEFESPSLGLDAVELTNEVEAKLVSMFKPKYNTILFSNYPNISSGTRSAGYTQSSLTVTMLPAILRTPSHTQDVVFPPDVP